MKALLNRLVIVLVALTLVGAAVPAAAQQASYYNPRQIERDVAPIALYPDQLLTQILMAATYPLEVGEAADWARDPRNAGRRGDDLAYALDQFDWDPSVKALVPFPRILEMLDSQPDWMDRLGEAFLAQEGDVMDAVQRLRAQAYAAGTLRGDGRLAVRYDGPSIVIGPAVPDEVYVPYYDPRVAYGDWAYPDEPPIYFPPPADYAYTYPAPVFGLAFFAPTPIVRPLWGWCDWDWGRRRVVIVRERYIVINRHREPHFAGDY